MSDEIGTNPDDVSSIVIITKIFSTISLISTILVISIYTYFKHQRSFYHEMILWFSITNGLYSLTSYIPYSLDELGFCCALQSVTLSWFQNAGYIWSALIGYTGFITVIKRTHLEERRKRYRVIFLIIAFGISGLISTM
jgi:hypothetical protein